MKRLSLDQVLNSVGILLGVTIVTLIVVNICVYGISNTASFEF